MKKDFDTRLLAEIKQTIDEYHRLQVQTNNMSVDGYAQACFYKIKSEIAASMPTLKDFIGRANSTLEVATYELALQEVSEALALEEKK